MRKTLLSIIVISMGLALLTLLVTKDPKIGNQMEETNIMAQAHAKSTQKTSIPPIDLQSNPSFKTATFALG